MSDDEWALSVNKMVQDIIKDQDKEHKDDCYTPETDEEWVKRIWETAGPFGGW